ncbi:MAG TPA: class I SAM-dependent methyltransferase family protein [Candidatus Methanofastidiosa archaeon]|nr:class I SAM-dependent methyltransferase family protein [Candidatus Methanofastidiosa archaeon]
MEQRHYREIIERLSSDIPQDLLSDLPSSYEVVGGIMLLGVPPSLERFKRVVAEAYLEVIGVDSVMGKKRISGEFREPGHELLAGDGTVTVHRENGIRYKIDLSRLMFSSGNINERIRMSKVKNVGHVVDMFAGIGYFSLPLAKHVGSRVTALEKNPVSYGYLLENIRINRLEDLITAMNIDCRDYDGPDAKRIVMGYVRETEKYLEKALGIAADGCIIHFHQTLPDKGLEVRLREQLGAASTRASCELEVLGVRKVKKYSPGVSHIVADLRVIF